MSITIINERLDFAKKEIWFRTPPKEIAKHFGYQLDKNFSKALEEFREETVSQARVTLYLKSLAMGFFSRWQPPLKKIPISTKC